MFESVKGAASETPEVSVITAAFNSSRFIHETIQTVQSQTFTNWEMIVVDDCSTDNTKKIVEEFIKKDKRIKIISLKSNSGAAIARNTAINAAKGQYIAFLDSDDLWYPQKLEKQLSFMKTNDIDFSFTGYEIINEDSSPTGRIVKVPREIDYKSLLQNTIIGCLTVMLNIDRLGRVQMPNIRTRQDYALWLSILKNGRKAYGLQECCSKYRKVKGSISSNKIKAAKKTWYVYRNIEKLSFLYSIWCFINYAWHATIKSF